MPETPPHGSRKVPKPGAVEIHDENSATEVTTPPPAAVRRLTRPSFVMELVAGTQVGEYEIERQIGEGAMGTVYAAVHPLIGKQVAIKVLKPELCANPTALDRFLHEAQAVNKIGHPNIVDVFSYNELPDGRVYLIMEWLRGEDLKARLAHGAMAVPDACDVLDGIARALEAAHAKDIVHRDLKPDNVFLHRVDDGTVIVKLLDFGIAKLVRATPGTEKTQTGNMLGTPRYISPEQARGIHVDHRSDIYSLGAMAFEMLAGKPPFDGETAMDLVIKHMSEPPPRLGAISKLPKGLEQVVMRMLDKDPANRPSLADLRAVLADPDHRATQLPPRSAASRSGPFVRPRARRRWPWVVAAIAGAAGVAGVVAWQLSATPEPARHAPAGSAVELAQAAPAPAPIPAPAPAPPPTPAPAPAAARGTLEVRVTGTRDAAILVDGKEWGRGALVRVELDPGGHDVTVRPDGRAAITRHVELASGEVRSVDVVLQPPGHAPAHPPARPHGGAVHGGEDDLLPPKARR